MWKVFTRPTCASDFLLHGLCKLSPISFVGYLRFLKRVSIDLALWNVFKRRLHETLAVRVVSCQNGKGDAVVGRKKTQNLKILPL
jgi:hypothetical protein